MTGSPVRARASGGRGFTPGKPSAGKMLRDALLVFVILAMALPFIVARIGDEPLTPEQEEQAKSGRRAAYEQQDWLANSMSNKVTDAVAVSAGTRFEYRYYTFFGLPWGSSEAVVAADGSVSDVTTSLTLDGIF